MATNERQPSSQREFDIVVPVHTAQLLLDTLRLPGVSHSASLCTRWERADTRGVTDLVKREGGELWLHRRLKQIGIRETRLVRTEFWDSLDRSAKKSVAQNLLVRSHAEYVRGLFVRDGVPHAPIKGIARQACTPQIPVCQLPRYARRGYSRTI